MALLKRQLNIALSQGVDTKSDPKQVVTGKMLALENATMPQVNEYTKRNGNSTLNSPLTAGNAISDYKNELVAMDGESLYSYSSEEQTFDLKGSKVSCDISTVPVIRNSQNQSNPDSATIQGLTCYVWQQYDPTNNNASLGIYASVFDNVTGQCITNNLLIDSSGINPKVRTLGTNAGNSKFVITYAVSANLYGVTINVSNPHAIAITATVLATGDSGVWNYDVCYLNNLLYIAHQKVSTVNIATFSVNSSLATSGVTTITQNCVQWVSISADPVLNQLWYATLDAFGGLVRYSVYSSAFAQILAPTIADSGSFNSVTSYASNGSGYLIYQNNFQSVSNTGFTQNFPAIKSISATNAGVLGSPSIAKRSLALFSKPFLYNGDIYVVGFFSSPIQPTFYVVNLNTHVVAKINVAQSAFLLQPITGYTIQGRLVEVNALSANEFQFPIIQQDLITPVSIVENTIASTSLNYPSVFAQTGIVSYFLTFAVPLVSEEIANGLQVSGGVVSLYDGASVAELGFNVFPETLQIGESIQGGILPGSYDYKVIYEWIDNYGQVHRSAPSIPASIDNTKITQTLSVSLTNASKVVTLPGPAQNIYIGMPISSTHIPASTTITNVFGDGLGRISSFTISANATGTIVEDSTITNQITFNGSLAKDSNQVTVGSIYKGIYQVGHNETNTSSYYFNNIRGVMVGMSVVHGTTDNVVDGLISTINGNIVTTSAPIYSGGGIEFVLKNRIYGTVTNGSNTITGISVADIARIAPLMNIDPNVASLFPGGTTVSGVSSSSIIMSVAATSSGSFIDLEMPNSVYNLWDGEVVTGTSITAGTQILNTNDMNQGNFNFNNNLLFLNENAAATVVSPEVITVDGVWGTKLTVNTLRLTEKTTPVNIILYRTLNNGSVYFRVSSAIVPPVNDLSVDYIYLFDNLPDNQIQGNEQLYTDGGVVDNISVPATSLLTQYQNRLLAVPSESPDSFWYSQQVIPGSPVEFSDALTWNVDSRGGPITALHQMDSNLILFKKNTIFYMNGSGPSPNGSSNDFTNPLLVSTDSGCIDSKSLVIMPLGLMYKSLKGIYLLDRSLGVNYIGADVEAYNSNTITSAQVNETLNQVRFTLDNSKVIVYDYLVKQWYVFTDISAVDSVSFQNEFTYLKSDGSIFQESSSLYTDNASFVPMKFQTGWLSLAGIQGFQRMYDFIIMADNNYTGSLQVDFAYDFDPTIVQSVIVNMNNKFQYRCFPQRMQCTSIQVTVTELQPSNLNQKLNLSGLALEVGIRSTLNKLPASQTYG